MFILISLGEKVQMSCNFSGHINPVQNGKAHRCLEQSKLCLHKCDMSKKIFCSWGFVTLLHKHTLTRQKRREPMETMCLAVCPLDYNMAGRIVQIRLKIMMLTELIIFLDILMCSNTYI